MTITIKELTSLARNGQLLASEHGVYRPHDGATEHCDNPHTGYRWDGTVETSGCPDDFNCLECDVSFLDSSTNEPVSAEDLGLSAAEYHAEIVGSLASDTVEGHITVAGRTVYAA
jgi:hypothetical protein